MDDLDEKTPFDIPTDVAEKEKLGQPHFLGTDPRRQQFLSQVTKFVFARNPFSRIFSLYMEKLFSPNPEFWGTWGQEAISLSRLDSSFHQCGAFVSFRHFVKLVVKELWKSDAHLIPVTELCHICKIRYDVIGKEEFATSDVRFLSEKLNVTTKFLTQPKYINDATHDVIRSVTRNAFGKWSKAIKKCMSSFDMGRIIWRRLQISGIIDGRYNFPLSEKDMRTAVGRKQFREVCFEAAKKSVDKKRLRFQRHAAFVEAYQTVDESDLEAIQGIYARDFYLLGYDYSLSSLFTKKKSESQNESTGQRVVYSKILDWRNPWDRNIIIMDSKKEVKVRVKYPL